MSEFKIINYIKVIILNLLLITIMPAILLFISRKMRNFLNFINNQPADQRFLSAAIDDKDFSKEFS